MSFRNALERFFFGKKGVELRNQQAAEREHAEGDRAEVLSRPKGSNPRSPEYVTVKFQDISYGDQLPTASRTYVYRWNVPSVEPEAGMFVDTPTTEGGSPSTAVIVREATPADFADARRAGYEIDDLKSISRVYTPQQVEAAVRRRKRG